MAGERNPFVTGNVAETLERLQESLADRYRVERELGRGGMATVFLATDVRHDREVAIKVLHPDLAATIGAERFEREIKLAAKLQHPHILALYDSGSAGELLYYVMPFVQGESLRDRLDREKQLPIDDAVQYALEVADALGYAHAHDIIHRDIKPENILISNGHALVADFGIARARTEAGQQKLTQTGMAVGTPVYMSPEQSTGEAVGPAADIYSLGCMLYEMLAGEPPFTGPNSMAIMAKHAMELPPSVRIVRPSVPEEVEEAILASMEKSPADRPKSAAEFAAMLGSPLGATATRRVTSRYTATRRVPSGFQPAFPIVPWYRRKPVLIGAAAAIVVATAGAWTLWGRSEAGASVTDPLSKTIAVLYFTDASGGELADVADRITESLIRDLEQVPEIDVISQNGVARFRNADVPRDSIARALGAGTLVAGTLAADGNSVSITTQLYDGSGVRLGDPTAVRVPHDSLFSAEESVTRNVAENLRRTIGGEISLEQTRAGVRNLTAWRYYSRGDRVRKDAEAAIGTDRPRAQVLFEEADSLARLARAADERWIEPLILRGEIARRRAALEQESGAKLAWLDSASRHAEVAISLDAVNAKALTLRGQATYDRSNRTLTTDRRERAALLDQAERELEQATARRDAPPAAFATLTFLYYDKKNVTRSLLAAQQAYDADRFLSNTSAILNRLFWGSYDTQLFARAREWCNEGSRRFPRNAYFTECQLWLLLTPDARADTAAAWGFKSRVDSLTQNGLRRLIAHTVVGGVIARTAIGVPAEQQEAIRSRARQVLEEAADAARSDPTLDPGRELSGYRAIMLTLMGDNDAAIRELETYVSNNPDHSFQVEGDVHWWWRDLRSLPGFRRLMDRR